MSGTNVFGPVVSRGQLRRSVVEHVKLWLPSYLRDAEREEDIDPGTIALPRGWQAAPDVTKWPETQLPAIVFTSPGLADREPEALAGDGSYSAWWVVGLSAVVHGKDEDDTARIADVYGSALRLLMLQQGGGLPNLDVGAVTWADEAYDDIPQRRARSLEAATVTFAILLRTVASDAYGPTVPIDPPTDEPGDDPTVIDTELTVESEALDG